MKNIKLNIGVLFLILTLFSACEKEWPGIYEGKPYVAFLTDENGYNIYVQQHISNFYYYDDQTRERDTVYLPLSSVAAIPLEKMQLELEAFDSDTMSYPGRIQGGTINAVPGVHYVPFESDEMQNLLFFHENQMTDSIPVIILRDETEKTATYRLTFRLVDTSDALAADKEGNRVVIYIADRVSRPTNWDAWNFGVYGDVKMDFMIRNSDLRWTYEDMDMVLNDSFLLSYYVYQFKEALKKENEALGENGPLREIDGTIVSFDRNY